MAKNRSKADRAARVTQLIAGLKKRFPNGSDKLTIRGGSSVTVDAAAAELEKFVDNRTAVTQAQAAAKAKVAAERADLPALDAFISAFEAFVKFTFGSDPTALADFGIAPPRAKKPRTSEQNAAAAAKAKATRAARGTKSPKAKSAIKGDVTGVRIEPVTSSAPAAPAAASVPAQTASNASSGNPPK